jgi:protein-disulfide isomerase
MNEENKTEEVISEEKKENILVIKKSTIFIIVIVIIAFIGGILGLRMLGFFDSENNTTDNNIEMIALDSPVMGDPNAKIFVVEYSDYECPYCEAAEGSNFQVISYLKQRDPTWEAPIPKVIEEYVNTGKVKLVFRQYPTHQNFKAAEATKCAQEQGKFWEYHQTLFENYEALTITDLKKYAADLELDLNQFSQCLDSGKYFNSVQNDMDDAKGLGVSGTPTFFIGNEEKGYEKIVGANSFSEFQKIIELKISV